MEYIHVKNLEKYLPGYTDRTFAWIKLYFRDAKDTKNNTNHTGIFNDVEFQELDEIDRYRFIALACMEAACGKPIPLTDRNMLWMGWNLKKRSKSKTLQVLQRFIVSVTEKVNSVPQSRVEESRVEENRVDKEEEYMSIFNIARKKYPSTKKGLSTEYANFVKKHADWKNILPLLLPAIERQIIWRAEDGRYWKNFQTWINQSSWEETASNQVQEKKTAGGKQKLLPLLPAKQCSVSDCKMPAVYKDTSGSYDHYACPDHLPAKVKEKYE